MRVASALFRGTLLAALQQAIRRGELPVDGPTQRTIAALHGTPWVVYISGPRGRRPALPDLGRYTHRVESTARHHHAGRARPKVERELTRVRASIEGAAE